MLFGEPSSVTGADYYLTNGFQGGGNALLDYGSMSVTCTYSKTTRSVAPSVIHGELGSLTIDSVADPALVIHTDLDGHVVEVLAGPPKAPNETLRYPIETFLRLCAGDLTDEPYRSQSIAAEAIISGLLRSAPQSGLSTVLTGGRTENRVGFTDLYTHVSPDGSRLGASPTGSEKGRQ